MDDRSLLCVRDFDVGWFYAYSHCSWLFDDVVDDWCIFGDQLWVEI